MSTEENEEGKRKHLHAFLETPPQAPRVSDLDLKFSTLEHQPQLLYSTF